ncbi:exo-beta-1,3-glucanase (GH17 family) [Bradyrhizobium sp. LM2.9]
MWWWLATPITLARAPIDPADKVQCVSYAPFRGEQSPLNAWTHIEADQIEQDLRQLKEITDCVRTYSMENGLDQVPAIAARIGGLKLLQGIWLSSNRTKNFEQAALAVRLSKDFPGIITSIIVGNEVLLRGEMTTADLVSIIRSVKAQVSVPVTYADVWEFWLKNREVYDAVDFVTIHILPYWEDFPVKAKFAAAHVEAIRERMAVAFPGKEILIGETGWPSEGRMREGALPSRTNQARVVSEILTLAKAQKFRVNLIESYDQPWKRKLEGTVGGYWGLYDSVHRSLKYPPGEPISNFPYWKWYMGAGMGLCVLVFAVAGLTLRRRPWTPRFSAWLGVAISATSAGILLGIGADKMYYESYGIGGWLLWGALLAAGILSPIFCAQAMVIGRSLTDLSRSAGPARGPEMVEAHRRAGPHAGGDRGDRGADRTRLRVRSALQGFPLCLADDGGGAVRAVDAEPAADRPASDRGIGIRGRADAVGRVRARQRGPRQLAVAVDLRDLFVVRAHDVAGAGRANPRMNRPIARPDSTTL